MARESLNRERVLRAGLTLADEGGVEALSMRKLADALGFEAMSLYRHVASKDDLLDGMLDLVLAEWEQPSPHGEWTAAIRSSALAVHDALRRHAWAAALLMAPKHVRPARLEYMEALLARLRGAGLSATATYHAYHVLDAHIFGFSLWELGHSLAADEEHALLERMKTTLDWSRYPRLLEHRDQHLSDGPHREVGAFEFGLDLILDGLAAIA